MSRLGTLDHSTSSSTTLKTLSSQESSAMRPSRRSPSCATSRSTSTRLTGYTLRCRRTCWKTRLNCFSWASRKSLTTTRTRVTCLGSRLGTITRRHRILRTDTSSQAWRLTSALISVSCSARLTVCLTGWVTLVVCLTPSLS